VEVSFVGKNGPYIIKFLKFSIEIFGKIDDQESKILPGTFYGMVICGQKRYTMQWIIEIFDRILDQIIENLYILPGTFCGSLICGQKRSINYQILHIFIEIFGKIDDQESKIWPGTFYSIVICGQKRYIMQWIIEIFDRILDQIIEKLYILPGTFCTSLICGQKRSTNEYATRFIE